MPGRSGKGARDRVRKVAGMVVTGCDVVLLALTVWELVDETTPLMIRITRGAVSAVRMGALRFSRPPRS